MGFIPLLRNVSGLTTIDQSEQSWTCCLPTLFNWQWRAQKVRVHVWRGALATSRSTLGGGAQVILGDPVVDVAHGDW